MDPKLKIKYRKNEKKYVVDYSKVKAKEDIRFELFKQMNEEEEIMVLLDTSLNKADPKKVNKNFYNLKDESAYNIISNYLEELGFDYKIRKVKRTVPRTILGFTAGKSDLVEDVLIAVHVPKAKLSKEFFEYILCTHDIMLGIKPKIGIADILSEFSASEFQRINEIEGFEYTLVDSHLMEYFYTDYKFSLS